MLFPPESPFVFRSIPDLSYLGLVCTLFLIWTGTGASMIPYHFDECRAELFFDGLLKAVASRKMKTDFKVSVHLNCIWIED